MIVALTGATGYIGRFLLERLVREGVGVRAWRRASSDLAGTPDGVEWIEGGLGDRDSMLRLVDGAGWLIHAAYDHVPGLYRGGEGDDLDGFIARNVGGSLALMLAARRAGVGRALVFSSRAVFGDAPRDGRIGDDAPPAPDTHYGAAKAALEGFTSSFGLGEGWPVAAIRPTGVYGLLDPPEKTKWWGLVGQALAGQPVKPRRATEVHGADVAEASWRILTAPAESMAGRMFNCSDITVSVRDIVAEAGRAAGRDLPLPEEGGAPKVVMGCPGLEALGMRFSGMERFRETVAAIVAARSAAGGA